MDETTDNLLATKGMSMTDEYIYHTNKAIEQYGPKTFVCLQEVIFMRYWVMMKITNLSTFVEIFYV